MQTGGHTVVDAALSAPAVNILGGSLGGHGVIQTALVTIGAGGVLTPGNSPGTLTIAGDLTVAGSTHANDVVRMLGGVIEIEIAGTYNEPGNHAAAQYDVVDVSGVATFEQGSAIRFVLYDSYSPANGDDIEFLLSAGLVGLANVTYSIIGLPTGFHYQVYEDGQADLHVRFYADGGSANPSGYVHELLYDGQAVPAPSTLALGILGFALLGWRARRAAASK